MLLSSKDKMAWFSSWWKLFECTDDGLAGWTVFPEREAVEVTLIMSIVLKKVKVKATVKVEDL